jgi:hypothetical protein
MSRVTGSISTSVGIAAILSSSTAAMLTPRG